MVLVIGSHMNRKSKNYDSITDAIKGESKIGGNIIQIFLGSSVKTTLTEKFRLTSKEIKEIKVAKKKYNVKIVVHGVLTLNMCSPLERRYQWNIDNLVYDLELNEKIGGLGVVIHMGTRKTKNFDLPYKEAEFNYVKNVKEALKRTKGIKSKVVLETSCNQPNKIGGTLELFAQLYKKFTPKVRERIGICVDTAHIFAAGYNIHEEGGMMKYWDDFDNLIGIENCTLIHLNDSKADCCSCVDRHETIGKGNIFKDTASLKVIVDIAQSDSIPMVLETKADHFKEEIKLIKKVASSFKKKKQKGSSMMDHKENIIDIFEQMYEFHSKLGNEGNNKTPFRAMGYRKALNGLKAHDKPIYKAIDAKGIGGIGTKFIEKIEEIIKTGTLSTLEEIKKNPKIKAKQEFQDIMGIGPKFAQELVNKHNITTIKELKAAHKNGKIKLNHDQLQGIKYKNQLKKRIPRTELEKWRQIIQKELENQKIPITACLVGSYILGKKDSGDIDIMVFPMGGKWKNKQKYIDTFLESFKKYIVYMISRGKSKIMMLVKQPKKGAVVRHMDLVFIEKNEVPWWLLYFGSDVTFSRKIRAFASRKGYKLNEKGLFEKLKNGKFRRVDFNPETEEEIFEYLGLDYIKPQDRLTTTKL